MWKPDRIDLTALTSLAVVLAVAVVFALIVGPSLLHTGTGESRYLPPQAPCDLTEYEAVKPRQAPGIDLAKALAGDPALQGWARDEFAKTCSACHGAKGLGDAPAGLALEARNFSKNEGWKNGPRITQIFKTLSQGLPPKMPGYDTYTPAQRLALAHVVQGFMAFPVPAATPAEVAALDQEYSLSAGIRETGRVPLRVALARRVEEGRAFTLDLAALPEDLRPLVTDAARAGQTLAGLGSGAPLAASLSAGAPGNGFAPAVAALSGDAWRRLAAALASASRAVAPTPAR